VSTGDFKASQSSTFRQEYIGDFTLIESYMLHVNEKGPLSDGPSLFVKMIQLYFTVALTAFSHF
jgi:hypothetical protein